MRKIIYWAAYNQDYTSKLELKPLLQYIAESQKSFITNNHITCPSIREKHKNTFYSIFPYDLQVTFFDKLYTNKPNIIHERQGLYEKSYAFDWEYERIFFSPTPQIMETNPAFLHQTSHSRYSHAPSGAFDIGQWFRPSSPHFQLWSYINEFKAVENEAHLYYNFPSNDKIIFQEFEMTTFLYDISNENISYKKIMPNQSLKNLYEQYKLNSLSKKIMNEIQNNLINRKQI